MKLHRKVHTHTRLTRLCWFTVVTVNSRRPDFSTQKTRPSYTKQTCHRPLFYCNYSLFRCSAECQAVGLN